MLNGRCDGGDSGEKTVGSKDKERVQQGRGRDRCLENGERVAGKKVVVGSLNRLVDIFLSLVVQ